MEGRRLSASETLNGFRRATPMSELIQGQTLFLFRVKIGLLKRCWGDKDEPIDLRVYALSAAPDSGVGEMYQRF